MLRFRKIINDKMEKILTKGREADIRTSRSDLKTAMADIRTPRVVYEQLRKV